MDSTTIAVAGLDSSHDGDNDSGEVEGQNDTSPGAPSMDTVTDMEESSSVFAEGEGIATSSLSPTSMSSREGMPLSGESRVPIDAKDGKNTDNYASG